MLYLDIRYTFGALRAGGQAGLPPADVFVHRPMANRLLMSWLDQVTAGPTVLRERLTLSLAILTAGIAGAGLARTLRGWTPAPVATGVGLATFTALAWAPSVTVLQPEWLATLLCVGAISLGLAGGPRRVASWSSPLLAGAGLLLAFAALQKYTTATTVVVALGIVFVRDRRRAATVAGWTAMLTALLLGLTLVNHHESQWFHDMPRLNPPGGLSWRPLGRSLWNLACLNPIIMLWPAATVLGFRVSRSRIWMTGCLVAVIVVMSGVMAQNGYFPYHYAALPVLAAALVALACGQWWQRTGRLPSLVLVGMAWTALAGWLARRPSRWRAEHDAWAVAGVVAVIVVSLSLALWQSRGPRVMSRQRSAPLVLALTLFILAPVITFPAWPHTPYAIYSAQANRASESAGRARAVEVGRQIRAAAGSGSVIYLARQDAPYFVGLPTSCPYPTATFLYRSARTADATRLASLQENLACLRDPTTRFLVLQPSMIDESHAISSVRETVAAEFDCRHPAMRAGSLLLCPRR